MFRNPSTARPKPIRRVLSTAVVASIAATGMAAVLAASPASAITEPNPPPGNFSNTASVTGTIPATTQTNVPLNGPLTALVSGTTVTLKFDGTGTPAAGNFVGVEVRICKGGLTNIGLQSQYNPTQGGNCLPPSGDPSISADTYGAANDRDIIATSDPTNTFATIPFKVGTGSVTFQANSVSTVTCNATNPCSLWAKEQFKTSFFTPGAAWWHFDLNYAGSPTAPATAAATAGNTTATVSWTAPTNAGNAPITGYTVTLSPGGASQTVSGSTTSANFTGLTNFTAYTASVTATNTAVDGSTNTSPAATANFTPTPPPPTNPSAVAADQSALLTWTVPTGPAPSGYSVVIHQVTPAGADIGPIATGSTGTSYNATGLTNGTVYTFQVAAVYGTTTGALSATSAPFTPQGKFVTQTITVTRPQGDLVLTQICGNHALIPADPAVGNWWPGKAAIPAVTNGTAPNLGSGPVDSGTPDPLFNQYPYPTDPTTGQPNPNYPTNCGINLGIARFITSGPGAGQFFQATGFMNQVTVVDTRDTDPGWTATGNMGTFTNASGKTFGGNQLGWTPIKTSTTPSFTDGSGNTYTQTAAAGAVVAPNTAGGMASGQPLGTAAAAVTTNTSTTGGLGIAVFDANLKLLIPVFAKAGTYTGVLTISAA